MGVLCLFILPLTGEEQFECRSGMLEVTYRTATPLTLCAGVGAWPMGSSQAPFFRSLP